MKKVLRRLFARVVTPRGGVRHPHLRGLWKPAVVRPSSVSKIPSAAGLSGAGRLIPMSSGTPHWMASPVQPVNLLLNSETRRCFRSGAGSEDRVGGDEIEKSEGHRQDDGHYKRSVSTWWWLFVLAQGAMAVLYSTFIPGVQKRRKEKVLRKFHIKKKDKLRKLLNILTTFAMDNGCQFDPTVPLNRLLNPRFDDAYYRMFPYADKSPPADGTPEERRDHRELHKARLKLRENIEKMVMFHKQGLLHPDFMKFIGMGQAVNFVIFDEPFQAHAVNEAVGRRAYGHEVPRDALYLEIEKMTRDDKYSGWNRVPLGRALPKGVEIEPAWGDLVFGAEEKTPETDSPTTT